MEDSYIQHSMDTAEFLEGKNAALRGDTQNPYPCGKQYLDWAIGFESIHNDFEYPPVIHWVGPLDMVCEEPSWFPSPWKYFR